MKKHRKDTLYINNTMILGDRLLLDFAHIPICFITLHAKLRFSQVEHICPVQLWDACKSIKITEKKKATTMHMSNKTDKFFL